MMAELAPAGRGGAGQVMVPPPIIFSGAEATGEEVESVAETTAGAGVGVGAGGSVAGGKNWSMVGWMASAQI